MTDSAKPMTGQTVAQIERELEEFCLWLNAEGLQHIARELASRVIIPAAPGAAVPAEPDMLAVCAALGFDPTNHHNAAKCPYCRPALEERELPPLPPTPYRCLSDLQSGTMPVWTEHQMRDYARAAIDSHTKGEK